MRSHPSALRDFTVDGRVWLLSGVALFIGAGAAALAVLLLRAIALPKFLAYSDKTCREVAEEMATTGVMNMPLVDRETGRVCGHIGAQELLTGRRRAVERESERNDLFWLASRQPKWLKLHERLVITL